MPKNDRKKFTIKLKNRMQRFKDASIDLSWIGTMDPDDHDEIEHEAKKEEKKMLDFVMDLYDESIQESELPLP